MHAEDPEWVGSYALVPRDGNGRRTPGPTTDPLERVWPPGEGPGDVGITKAVGDGVPQTGKDLAVRAACRHAGYLPRLGGETTEGLLTGLPTVFTRIGGVPRRRVFDNASTRGRQVGDGVRLTACFQRVWAPDRFTATLCHPDRGHEQGSGENQVGSRRRPRLDRRDAEARRRHYRHPTPVAPWRTEDRAACGSRTRAPLDPVRYVTVPPRRLRSMCEGWARYDVTALGPDGAVGAMPAPLGPPAHGPRRSAPRAHPVGA